MENEIFPHTFWRPFLDCMPRLFFRPKYVWFPVHLKGPMIPDPSGQLAELTVYITSTRVDLYSHQIQLTDWSTYNVDALIDASTPQKVLQHIPKNKNKNKKYDYPYHWFILDPKSKEDNVKITNLKKMPKLQLLEFWNEPCTRLTFWSCFIRCANMRWIRLVLWKIQNGHDSVHRRTDGRTDGRTDKVYPL